MESLLDRRLIVVTGKGGVGKTTIAAALGMLASRAGRRTVIVEVNGASPRLSELFCSPPAERGTPARLAEGLSSLAIDPEMALLEWMQTVAGRLPARLLASKASFQYFAAAAPGAKELVAMVKVWGLTAGKDHDLVILDAPATGHALAMLDSPQTIGSIARAGAIADQAEAVRGLLRDRVRTGYLAVARASEMAISETIDLRRELNERIGVDPDAVVLNATVRRRFTNEELSQITSLTAGGGPEGQHPGVAHAAAAAAAITHAGRRQSSQAARLRRHGMRVLRVPFIFQPDLDLAALEEIGKRLQGRV